MNLIEFLTSVKTLLNPIAKTYRADQLERDVNGAIKSPSDSKYFVIFDTVSTPGRNWSYVTGKDTVLRISAWADDANEAISMQLQAESILEDAKIQCGRLTQDVYSKTKHGYTREVRSTHG